MEIAFRFQDVRLVTILSFLTTNLALRTPAEYSQTRYYGKFALSLRKERPYIFSKFNILNTETLLI